MPTLFLPGTHGWSLAVLRVRRSSSILGCSCAHRRHVQSNQHDGRSICGLHGDEGVGYENELSKVGQSRVRAYQTVPRLQDRTAQRHQRRFWGRVVQGPRCRYEIFGARSSDVLKRMQKAVLSSSLNIARTFNR